MKSLKSTILQGKNADHIFTLHLREKTEQTLRKSFEKIKYKMNIDYIGDFGVSGIIPGIVSLITNNESLLKQTVDINNKSNEADQKIQNFEQKWISSIPYIHEADIDKLFWVLINHKSGFDAALAYLREEIKIITPRPFKQ
jgi:hypothetical protein